MKTRANAIQALMAAVLLICFGLGQQSAALIKAATTTVVVSSANPSISGQLITFTATVKPKSGTGTPAGTVSFQLGSNVLCDFPISGGVNATCNVTSLPVGTDAIKATYLGDLNFLTSSGTVHQKVTAVKSSTTTVVTSMLPTSAYGQSVKFTATVSSSAGMPADGEKVTFKNGSATLGVGTIAGGVATFTTSTLSVGSHTINAFYAGDTQFLLSPGSVPQAVQKVSTSMSVSAPQGAPGQPVTITANLVSLYGASTPIQAGEVRLQTGSFADSSMNGLMVFHMDGLDGTSVSADIGVLNANGTGSLTGTDYGDDGGTSKTESLSGTYAVASNGRVTLNIGGPGGFSYLTGPNTGFLLDSGGGELGEFEPQSTGPFTNASLSGAFFHGTNAIDNHDASTQTGTATLDGAGNISGAEDKSGSNGLSTQSFTDNYSVNSDGSGNIGSGTVMMVISNNKLVFIDEGDGGTSTNPEVTVVEK